MASDKLPAKKHRSRDTLLSVNYQEPNKQGLTRIESDFDEKKIGVRVG